VTDYQLFDALPTHVEDALRASIERFGVLVPVVRDQHGVTIDGHHRARLADELGVTYRVDVVSVADENEAREIARHLNSRRRHLSGEQLKEHIVMLAERTTPSGVGELSQPEIAKVAGVSQPYVSQVLSDPELISTYKLPGARRGADGKVRPAKRPTIVAAKDEREAEGAQEALSKLSYTMPDGLHTSAPEGVLTASEARRAAAKVRAPEPVNAPVPPPPGKYQCIVIDPPWPMQKIERDERPNQGVQLDYPVMTLDDIADEQHVPVRTLAADDCHIYLWVTHKFLPAGLNLLEGWGFNYQCVMTWRKNVGITPFSWMYDTEHVLFGRRGNLPLQRLGMRLSFEAPVRGHSVKPDVFYERVLEATPGPRVEMFARRNRDGFTAWGNEVADVV
jgi:N6-adenosine-specific RNA methylase IME4